MKEVDRTPRLLPEGAFVVQFHADMELERQRISGRIEHLMSGDSAPFTSLETLLTFVAQHTGTASEVLLKGFPQKEGAGS